MWCALPSTDDQFVVMASDGLWDVLNGQQVIDAVIRTRTERPDLSLDEVAHELCRYVGGEEERGRRAVYLPCVHRAFGSWSGAQVCVYVCVCVVSRLAMRLGSADNITVVIIDLEFE